MDAFEYLSVLISIVLGLGITQLLLGFGRWLERRRELRAYGPAIAWACFLLLVHVQTWWSMYGLRHYMHWTFLQFAVVLLQPIVLFLLATIVFPGPAAPHQDLRANFMEQRPWFFGLFVALLGVSLLRDLVRDGHLPDVVNLGFHAALFGIGVAGLVTKRTWVHRLLAYGSLTLFVAYIGILFANL